MTLNNAYSWSPVKKRVFVPYEPSKDRRVNAVGALFYRSRQFLFSTRARAPKTKRAPMSFLAAGLELSELGPIDAQFLIDFLWRVAGRPEGAPGDWRRPKPLVIVLDNHAIHKSARMREERLKWQAADVDLFFLPSYSPELSGIEPLWQDVKQHRMRRLSRNSLLELKRDVDAVLAQKASELISVNSVTGTA